MSRSKNNPRPPSKSRLRRKRQLRRRRRRNRRLRKQQARYQAYFNGVNWQQVQVALRQLTVAMQKSMSTVNYMAQSLNNIAQQMAVWGGGFERRGVKIPGWERPEPVGDGVTDNAALIKKLNFYSAYGIVKVPQPQAGGQQVPQFTGPTDCEIVAVRTTGRAIMRLEGVTTERGLTPSGIVGATTVTFRLRGLTSDVVGRADLMAGMEVQLTWRDGDGRKHTTHGEIVGSTNEWTGMTEFKVQETPIRGVQVAGVGLPESVPGRFGGDAHVDTSGDVPDVPDYCWGWRLFKVQGYDEDENVMVYGRTEPAFTIATSRTGQLLSWGKIYQWGDKRQTAVCLYSRENKIVHEGPGGYRHYSQAPDPRCECGFWATWHPQDLPLGGKGYNVDCVVAKVKAWGDIVEAPRGFRAPQMEIVEVALVNEEGEATLGRVYEDESLDPDDPRQQEVDPLLYAVMKKYHVNPLSELIQENEPT